VCLAYLTPLTISGQSVTFSSGSPTAAIAFVTLKSMSIVIASPTLDMNIGSSEYINCSFASNSAQGNISILLPKQEINIANLSISLENYNVTTNSVTSNINVAQTNSTFTENVTANTYTFTITSVANAFPTYNITVPVLTYTI